MPWFKKKQPVDAAAAISEILYREKKQLAQLRVLAANETPPGDWTLQELKHEIKLQELLFEINQNKLAIVLLEREYDALKRGS
jgi:hypothetical protein